MKVYASNSVSELDQYVGTNLWLYAKVSEAEARQTPDKYINIIDYDDTFIYYVYINCELLDIMDTGESLWDYEVSAIEAAIFISQKQGTLTENTKMSFLQNGLISSARYSKIGIDLNDVISTEDIEDLLQQSAVVDSLTPEATNNDL